jgi:hypothetical protein
MDFHLAMFEDTGRERGRMGILPDEAWQAWDVELLNQLADVVYLRIMEYLRPINPTLQKKHVCRTMEIYNLHY